MTREQVAEIVSQTVELTIRNIFKEINQRSDQISQNEAFRQFGRTEIESLIRDGKISTRRIGEGKNSKKVLSKVEIIKALASYTTL